MVIDVSVFVDPKVPDRRGRQHRCVTDADRAKGSEAGDEQTNYGLVQQVRGTTLTGRWTLSAQLSGNHFHHKQ